MTSLAQATTLITRRRWLSSGLRRRVANALCPRRSTAFETETLAGHFHGRLDSYIDREMFFLGEYETGVLWTMTALATRPHPSVFLDVGANVGVHTLAAARVFAEVHAFEPFPPIAAALRANVALNRLTNVHVHVVGLGERDGEGSYAAPVDGRGGYGGFDNDDPRLTQHRLPVRAGAPYLDAIPVGRLDVVKIDIEGFEGRAIRGLAPRLASDRPAIILEYWPAAWPNGLLADLPHDYRVWRLHEPGRRFVVLQGAYPTLGPAERLSGGDTALALPVERPIPAGLVSDC